MICWSLQMLRQRLGEKWIHKRNVSSGTEESRFARTGDFNVSKCASTNTTWHIIPTRHWQFYMRRWRIWQRCVHGKFMTMNFQEELSFTRSSQGDGGAPLVCQLNGQFYVVGLVAWGIGCGSSNIPGVYTNVAHYYSWIQSNIVYSEQR